MILTSNALKVSLLASLVLVAMPNLAQAFTTVDCINATHRTTLGGISEVECQFLDDIYTDTAGAGWTDNTNWDTLSDIDTWNGVTRTGTTLTEVDLTNNNLSGTAAGWVLPPALEVFSLARADSLTGDISTWVLPSTLQRLFVEENDLTGDLSTWVLPGGLDEITLFNNAFSGDI